MQKQKETWGPDQSLPLTFVIKDRGSQERLQADFFPNFLSEPVAFLVHPGFKAGKEVGPGAGKGVEHHVPAIIEQVFFIGDVKLAIRDGSSEQLIDPKLLARRSP